MNLIRKVSEDAYLSAAVSSRPIDLGTSFTSMVKSDGFRKPPSDMSVILLAPYPFLASGQAVRSTRVTY